MAKKFSLKHQHQKIRNDYLESCVKKGCEAQFELQE